MNRFEVSEDDAGRRLDVALADWLGISRSRVAVLVTDGQVVVDGARVSRSTILRAGQTVEVADADVVDAPAAPEAPPILYADDHLLVIDKPAGLVVHAGAGHDGDTLVDALRAAGHPLADVGDPTRPGIVHRLDRDTSGVMVVACTPQAHRGLVEALSRREVTRHYLALVAGVPAAPRGRVEGPIGRDPRQRTRFAVVTTGRDAVTRYATIASGSGLDATSLLACRLETGRTHQIRVHLTEIGHPVIGDPSYGRTGAVARTLGLRRQALHAAHLVFEHPVDGRRVEAWAPVPADLAAAIEASGIELPEDLAPHWP
ncbi:MAG: RluA family pseudouridine synthase [Nitriliruptoraceae bacterium]